MATDDGYSKPPKLGGKPDFLGDYDTLGGFGKLGNVFDPNDGGFKASPAGGSQVDTVDNLSLPTPVIPIHVVEQPTTDAGGGGVFEAPITEGSVGGGGDAGTGGGDGGSGGGGDGGSGGGGDGGGGE